MARVIGAAPFPVRLTAGKLIDLIAIFLRARD
jgi:hypothetical protein